MPELKAKFTLAVNLSLVFACLLGSLTMYGFITVIKPLNLLVFVALWLLLPWCIFIAAKFLGRPINQLFTHLFLKRSPIHPAKFRLLNALHASWAFCFALFASLTLFLSFVFNDLPFYWSTSIDNLDDFFLAVFSLLDSPWQSWLPAAAFDEHWFQLAQNGDTSQHVGELSRIWPFVMLLLISYNLVPRLLILLMVLFSNYRFLRAQPLTQQHVSQPQTPLAVTQIEKVPQNELELWPIIGWQLAQQGHGITHNFGLNDWQQDIDILKQLNSPQVFVCVLPQQSPTLELMDFINASEVKIAGLLLLNQHEASQGQIVSWQNYAQRFQLRCIAYQGESL